MARSESSPSSRCPALRAADPDRPAAGAPQTVGPVLSPRSPSSALRTYPVAGEPRIFTAPQSRTAPPP